MRCPKCASSDVSVQVMEQTRLVPVHHGILWWVFIGWWWVPVKWIFLTVPAVIMWLFKSPRYKTQSARVSLAVCQRCGYTWEVHRARIR